jgi:saccharopine dehydrogenase-like NADP-dependent oxidoreductase
MRILVLGGGMVGNAIARDLALDDDFQVTVVDISEQALAAFANDGAINTVQADLSNSSKVASLAGEHDLVVGAVPGHMGFSAVRAALEMRRDVVDISFFPEDPALLDGLARERGVRCLVDFGVAPGCSNLLFGHAAATLARMERFTCYVGGLPVERVKPWEYKAPFSPIDVLEEYTRPARYISGGRLVTRPALAEPELIDFPGVGTLEAFLTDGLRSLLRAEGVTEMVEKTCRYPGHRDLILALKGSGFFELDPVEVAEDCAVRPMDLTARLLIDSWRLAPGEEDLTAMRVEASGYDATGTLIERRWQMLDRYDRVSGTTSMARTTGYTCTAGVRLLTAGLWQEPGLAPPELIGRHEACFTHVMKELRQRGVVFEEVV